MAKLVALALALALAALVLVCVGAVPLSASAGHWPITEWVLQFTKRRTVQARSLAIVAPRLDDAALVLRGAGHFESGCKPCHGAPGTPPPVVLQEMAPRPPWLSDRLGVWEADDLFWIVKHGIKLTGMPGWPAQERDDEVWAMVAFLERLPSMDEATYRRLVFGAGLDPEALEPAVEGLSGVAASAVRRTCARCHGLAGEGRGAAFPRLAGQKPAYLAASLAAYAADRRHSGIMQPMAEALSPETRRELALHYAALDGPFGHLVPPVPADLRARGEAIAVNGIPERRVPACSDCHGPAPSDRNPLYPLLAGQHPAYLLQQLELFQAGRRGGTRYAHLMREVVEHLEPSDLRAVAAYYGSLTAGESGTAASRSAALAPPSSPPQIPPATR